MTTNCVGVMDGKQQIFAIGACNVDGISGAQRECSDHIGSYSDTTIAIECDVGATGMFQQIFHLRFINFPFIPEFIRELAFSLPQAIKTLPQPAASA